MNAQPDPETSTGPADPSSIVVLVTAPNVEEAEGLAGALVEERLAACVNRIEGITSTYRWEGEIHHDKECLLIIKTRQALFGPLRDRILEKHSYSNPEIIALPIVEGAHAYLNWIAASTS